MYNVLIVEDNKINQTIINKILQPVFKDRNLLVNFIFCPTGEEAVNICKENDLFLVILNGYLEKEMTGPEAFIRMCKIKPEITKCAFGWSGDFKSIEEWNLAIEDKYNNLPADQKPVHIPKLTRFLDKLAINKTKYQSIIGEFIDSKEGLSQTTLSKQSFFKNKVEETAEAEEAETEKKLTNIPIL